MSYITDISLQDLKELFEIRGIIECHPRLHEESKKSLGKTMSMIEDVRRDLLKNYDPLSIVSVFNIIF